MLCIVRPERRCLGWNLFAAGRLKHLKHNQMLAHTCVLTARSGTFYRTE
ncbi:MAG: hypothetical protein JWQ08_426 [Deinococcus sp.]|nr:hypothetical protein [Deinococcus sp.]